MKKLILAVLIAMTSGAAIAENEQIVFSTPNLAMPFEVHMQRTANPAAAGEGPPQIDAAAAVGLRATARPIASLRQLYLPLLNR